MNWVIFTTECSGKTTFAKNNKFNLNEYQIVDWDVIKTVPDIRYENELMFIDLIVELQKSDNKIYLTNIVPPDFIFGCKDYFKNINFAIILIKEEQLIKNIKTRHHPQYNSEYIIDKYNSFRVKIGMKNEKIKVFNNFEEFKNYLYPPASKLEIKQRIIRL